MLRGRHQRLLMKSKTREYLSRVFSCVDVVVWVSRLVHPLLALQGFLVRLGSGNMCRWRVWHIMLGK